MANKDMANKDMANKDMANKDMANKDMANKDQAIVNIPLLEKQLGYVIDLSQKDLDNLVIDRLKSHRDDIRDIIIEIIAGESTVDDFFELSPSWRQVEELLTAVNEIIVSKPIRAIDILLAIFRQDPNYFKLFLVKSKFDTIDHFVTWTNEQLAIYGIQAQYYVLIIQFLLEQIPPVETSKSQ
jgi:hypothetical protein